MDQQAKKVREEIEAKIGFRFADGVWEVIAEVFQVEIDAKRELAIRKVFERIEISEFYRDYGWPIEDDMQTIKAELLELK